MPKLSTSSQALYDYFPVYRLDIRQGNYVTQDMASKLKRGQTREQVRFVLGTALLADPFHGDRWDYVYRYDSGRGDVQQRKLTVYFEDNKLARVSGDVVAAGLNAAETTEKSMPSEGEDTPAKADEPAESTPTPAPEAR